MKNILRPIELIGILSLFIMGCEHPIRMETKVHEDGSLDKIIELEKADSGNLTRNIFNINATKGWSAEIKRADSDSMTSGDEFKIRFEKQFASVEEANQDLKNEPDTLFSIESNFDKSFRWFYTYIRYSETFRRIDRLKKVKGEDYFNQEDRSFINRLPGEGVTISKADSFYLQTLNKKIFQDYGRMGMFREYLDIMAEVIKRNIGDNWVDSLYKESEYIFYKLEDMEGDPFFAMKMMDSLNIPLPKEIAESEFKNASEDLNSRISFMGYARDGKYTNIIEMPWTIIASNADSVAGNSLYWRPLVTKFAIQDYEMYAEVRKLNVWTIFVSLIVVGFTFWLFLRSKK
jgi:hypothetical protein